MDAVRVPSALEYRADGSGRALTFDLYAPPDAAARAPAVVFAMGFLDPVVQAAVGGESLGIDGNRIGVWACSGHVPTALSACMAYGFMLDLDGATHVAEVARSFGFANPSAGRSVADLRRDLALFVVRAGRDRFAHLNDAIDGFVAQASRRNLPLAFQNLRMLGFLRFHLLGENTPT